MFVMSRVYNRGIIFVVYDQNGINLVSLFLVTQQKQAILLMLGRNKQIFIAVLLHLLNDFADSNEI